MQTLLRRDLPLDQGRMIRFAFTVEIDVPVDEDALDGEPRLTLDQLEEAFAETGRFYSPDDLYRGLRRYYGSNVLDHSAWLIDVGPPTTKDGELRFERLYEKNARESNDDSHEIITRNRVWLDEIPPAGGKGGETDASE